MIYIGIVGSRKRTERIKIMDIIVSEKKKHRDIIVVSGGAEGIDLDAYWACEKLGVPILTYFPNIGEYSEKGNNIYSARNWLIAKISTWLYAFPLNRKGGTMNTVGHFKNFGKENCLKIID